MRLENYARVTRLGRGEVAEDGRVASNFKCIVDYLHSRLTNLSNFPSTP